MRPRDAFDRLIGPFGVLVVTAALALLGSACGGAADAERGGGTAPSGPSSSTSGASSSGDSGASTSTSSSSNSEEDGPDGEEAGQLTAAAWRDLDNWEFWTGLFNPEETDEQEGEEQEQVDWTEHEESWKMQTRNRYAVRVVSGSSPAVDAPVKLVDQQGETIWQTRTDNRGRAELFNGYFGEPAEGPITIVARAGERETVLHEVEPTGGDRIELNLESGTSFRSNLDVMFMIDTTGSMSDELSYIQSELEFVIDNAREEVAEEMSIRTSVNLYRDTDDEYTVKNHPFRDDVSDAVSDLHSESAAGGGDFPEAVGRALEAAVDEHNWSDRAQARLMFLVLDAPPHNNPEVREKLSSAVKAAAEKGVRIIPVTASGIDKSTEFLMRSYDIATGGTYVFLTDHSGIGGDHIEPTIGDYDVRYLNRLLVDIISKYGERVEDVSGSGSGE